jgi:hypothetical protein
MGSVEGQASGEQPAAQERRVKRGGAMLGAVATLLALTPRGRNDELKRLTALAHGFIGAANEDELVTLARAVAGRDDLAEGLAERLARTSKRCAHVLIRASALGDEAIAYLLEEGDQETRHLIAQHCELKPAHVTMLVASGQSDILKALLANRQSDLDATSREAAAAFVQHKDEQARPQASTLQTSAPANPRTSAQDFARLDTAARRAVLRRLAEDGTPGSTALQNARRNLDPTRHEADLAFLTVIEQRDAAKLAATFARTLQLDGELAARLVDEADGDAMIVLAKAAGLSSTAFARLVILSKIGLTGSPRDTFALVDRFKALPEATALFVVKAMREGSLAKTANAASSPTPARRPVERSQSLPLPRPQIAGGHQGFRKAV